MTEKKSPSRFEYILTYLWAFLLIGGTLAIFSVFIVYIAIRALNLLFNLSIELSPISWLAIIVLFFGIQYFDLSLLFKKSKVERYGLLQKLLIIIYVVVYPLLFIWSLNIIFALKINYTILTWLAALAIVGIFRGISTIPFESLMGKKSRLKSESNGQKGADKTAPSIDSTEVNIPSNPKPA